MVTIIPAVLQLQRQALEQEIERMGTVSPFLHIDVTGSLVDAEPVAFEPSDFVDVLSNDILGLQYQVHLMLTQEELKEWLPEIITIDTVSAIIIHHEIGQEVLYYAQMVRSANKSVIVALNPDSPLDAVDDYLGKVDGIMIMGVVPGEQGKPFEPATIDRVAYLHQHYPQLNIIVDGAVSLEEGRAQKIAKAGADTLVVGSKIRDAHDPLAVYDAFTAAVNQ